jgi:CYTH domain-containing protein
MSAQLEIERKYIIRMPRVETLSRMPNFTESDILQLYLENTKEGASHRIRKRVYKGKSPEYIENTKLRIDGMTVVEWEQPISASRFEELSRTRPTDLSPVYKTRYTFDYLDKTVEIDVYPQWKHACVMEIELTRADDVPGIPSFIHVIKDVTGDNSYSNHTMAREFPPEPQE